MLLEKRGDWTERLLSQIKTLLLVIDGRYSGKVRTKLLVRSTCVSRQLAVSSYSVWTGDVVHTFTVLELYM